MIRRWDQARAEAREGHAGVQVLRGPDRAVYVQDQSDGKVRLETVSGEVIGAAEVSDRRRRLISHDAPNNGRPADRLIAEVDVAEATSVPAFDIVKRRLRAAGQTLRRLEAPREIAALGRVRSQLGRFCPEAPILRPSTRQISQCEECLDWVFGLDGENRRLCLAHMVGVSQRRLARELGCSHTAIQKRYAVCVRLIVERLAGAVGSEK